MFSFLCVDAAHMAPEILYETISLYISLASLISLFDVVADQLRQHDISDSADQRIDTKENREKTHFPAREIRWN